jgi:hypothetical protein
LRAKVAGTHRRHRPSPRPGRGPVWIGLFLLLAVVALAISQDLWTDLARNLIGTERRPVPQGAILWQAQCPSGAIVSVNSWGVLLLAHHSGGEEGQARKVTFRRLTARDNTVLAVSEGSPVAVAFRNREAAPPDEAADPAGEEWRGVVVRPLADGPAGAPGGFPGPAEQIIWVGQDSGAAEAYVSHGAVVTAAYPWVEGARAVFGLYYPDMGTGPQSAVVAVGEAGQELWTRAIDRLPVHRVVSRPGSGFIAAATPGTVALLDSRGNLLWSKTIRSKVTDVALQSHGGPAVISGRRLLVYDRRGNLLWRKDAEDPLKAVACAGNRIAVAHGARVVVYDEEGLARWSLTCPEAAVEIALDAEAGLVAVVLESGAVIVARAPGGSAAPRRDGPERFGSLLRTGTDGLRGET